MIRSYGPLVRTRNTITAVAYLSIRGTAKVSTIACHSHVHTPSHADNASAYTRLYRQRGKESTFLLCLSFPLPQFFSTLFLFLRRAFSGFFPAPSRHVRAYARHSAYTASIQKRVFHPRRSHEKPHVPRMDRPIEKQEKVVVWNWGLKDLDTPNLGKRGYHADLDANVRRTACR